MSIEVHQISFELIKHIWTYQNVLKIVGRACSGMHPEAMQEATNTDEDGCRSPCGW